MAQPDPQMAPNILIVEDQPPMRRALRDLVQTAIPGSAVLEAETGEQALALSLAQHPDVVLMDVRLPDANGIELTARIRTLLPGTAVIVVSALTGRRYVEHARAAGAFAFVAKDHVYRDLLRLIESALARNETQTGR